MYFVVSFSLFVFLITLLDGVADALEKSRLVPGRGVPIHHREGTSTSKGPRCMYPTELLKRYIQSFDHGRVLLLHGRTDIEISTTAEPKSVWVAETTKSGVPGCGGGRRNMYGVTILPGGFILHAEITSEYAEIRWESLFVD